MPTNATSNKTFTRGTLFMALLLLGSNAAQGDFRPRYEDPAVVERSELVVVARLDERTIEWIPRFDRQEGASWKYHATLVIEEVLKGECEEKEIPIVIHFGLRPIVGPKGRVEIHDTMSSVIDLTLVFEDAREDHLWFLRRRSGKYGHQPGTGNYGIVDPEDFQALKWKDYLLAYMADDPETAVRKWATENPDNAERAKRYLDHMEVRCILEIEDAGKRFDELLPFYLNRTTWNMKPEAREGIIACGTIAGEGLEEVFVDPESVHFREDIILMWRDIGYRKAVPILIDLLARHDRFWAEQDLKEGWWNDVGSEENPRRRAIYGEVFNSLWTLRAFKDPRAKEVLKMTRDRWQAVNFDNTQIVEACDAALRELSESSD